MSSLRRRASALACASLASLAATACSEPLGHTIPLTFVPDTVALGTLTRDSTWGFGSGHYVAAVTPGARYVAAVVGLSDSSVTLRAFEGEGLPRTVTGRGAPKDITVTAASSFLGVEVVGGEANMAHYTVTVVPAPSAAGEITGTSGAVALGVPTIGWVDTRGRSRYHASGTAGPRTVSLVGLTDDARLRVFADDGYTQELDCTLRDGARECSVPGSSIYFAVEAGPLNRTGAGYVMIVR